MKKTQIFLIFALIVFSYSSRSQIGTVLNYQKISSLSANFTGDIDPEDHFCQVANIGDLNGDGFTDIAVGAFSDDDGDINTGAVWILFLNSNSEVIDYQKISALEGNFSGQLKADDRFGYSVCSLGDLDGDEITDIAVGAVYDDDGDINTGAVWILFLNLDGTVKNHQKISKYHGNFNGNIDPHDFFGINVSNIGDFDNDGITDLGVGATGDADGGYEKTGALWFLYLNNDGTVKSYSKISATQGNFFGSIDPEDRFGRSCSALGDLDMDGVNDFAVGAITDDDGGYNRGAVWILFLNSNGTVKSYNKISSTNGNLNAVLDDDDQLGLSTSPIGDMDGDGVLDIAVSCHNDDDGGLNRGAVYIIFLNSDGSVKNHQKISNLEGGFNATLSNGDTYGAAISCLGDVNSDGNLELACGSPFDDDGGMDKGAVWVLTLDTYTNSISNTEESTGNYITIYPNPFKEKTIFSYNSDIGGKKIEYIINIYNSNGTKVFSTIGEFTSSLSTTSIVEWSGKGTDGAMLQKGIYYSIFSFTNVNGEYFSQTRKIILQ